MNETGQTIEPVGLIAPDVAEHVEQMSMEGDQRGALDATKREVARLFQEAAVEHVVQKVRLAIEREGRGIRGLVVSGGVACNLVLRGR